MTTLQTLREPKAGRLRGDLASQNLIEPDEPGTPLERYDRWCHEVSEREKRDGTFDVEPPTMEEIVAIVKEARAERYAKEQKQRNLTCR